jgi:hypothetical protein
LVLRTKVRAIPAQVVRRSGERTGQESIDRATWEAHPGGDFFGHLAYALLDVAAHNNSPFD